MKEKIFAALLAISPLGGAVAQEKLNTVPVKNWNITTEVLKHNDFLKYESIERIPESFKHINSCTFELKSKSKDGEYYPSKNLEIFKNINNTGNEEENGSLNKRLKLINKFGLNLEETSTEKITELINKNKEKINDNSIEGLKEIIKDPYVYDVVDSYFINGGSLDYGYGHYSPSKITTEGQPNVMYHELIHYILDKDQIEIYKTGGDHEIISPIESRWWIINSIEKGYMPLNEEICELYGFTEKGKAGDKIKKLIENKNMQELKEYVNSTEFFDNIVQSGITSPISSNEFNKNNRDITKELSNGKIFRLQEDYKNEKNKLEKIVYEEYGKTYIVLKTNNIKNYIADNNNLDILKKEIPDEDWNSILNLIEKVSENKEEGRRYIYSEGQLNDMAYLCAYNATLISGAFQLAYYLSDKESITIEEIFKSTDFKLNFYKYKKELADSQEDPINNPLKISCLNILSDIMPENK